MFISPNPYNSLSIEELLLRLEEAEETLRAIRSGEVDALIVSGAQGDQVFTLKDATHPYQILIEEMNEGALTLAFDGMIHYCNSRFAEILDFPREAILGESFFHFVIPGDQTRVRELLEQSREGSSRGELTLLGSQTEIPVAISLKEIKLEGELRLGVMVSDLTERKRAENEIRSLNTTLEQRIAERTQQLEFERSRWQGIVEGIADEVWSCDAQGNMSLLNFGTGTGSGLDAFKDKSAEDVYQDVDFFYPDGQPRPLEQIPLLRSLRGEIVRGEEIMRNRRTGQTRYRQFSSAPTRNETGVISGAVAITRDITEQKHAEEGLHRFELLSEYSKDIVLFMHRADGRILEANLAAQRAYGYSRDELLSITIRKLRARGTRELTGGQMVQADHEGILFETIHQRKDGSTFPVEISSQGAVIGGVPTLVNIVRDISERKRAQAKLANQAELLSRVRDAVIGTDEKLQVTYWNAAAEEMFGWTAEEATGREAAELFKTQPQGYIRDEAIQKLMAADKFDDEVRYARKDDSYFIGHAVSTVLRGSQGDFQGLVTTVRDVTERKQADEKQAYLASFPEQNPNPIAEADFDGQVRYVNPAALRTYPDLLQQGLEHAWLADWDTITRLFRKGQTDVKIREVVVGEHICQQTLQYLPQEHIIRIYGMDISERRRAEEQLEQSNLKLNEILTSIQDNFYALDRDWNFVYASRLFTSKVGMELEDIVGKNFWKMFPKDLGTVLEENFHAAMEKREIRRFEMGGKYTAAWYRMTAFPSADGITVIGTDITERKQAEEKLRTSEAKFRTLFETMTEGFAINEIICDEAGKPYDIRYLEANLAFERQTGLRVSEILGHTTLELFPDAEPVWFERYGKVALAGEPLHFQERFGPLDRWFEVSAYQTEPRRFATVFFDITERKQAEEQLSAALQEKEVLLKEIHHRVKNNLQVISSLLRLQSAYLEDPQVRELFADSQRRVRAMALIHEQLYRSSSLARINFKDYIHNLVIYLRRSYTQAVSNVQIRVTVEDVIVEIDQAIPLGLIVSELVSNSLKHAFPSANPAQAGEIWISARRESSDSLTLSVGDNGVGLPENLDIEHSPTMGLQLVKSFVTQLQGQLTIQRKQGTVFTVTIPEKRGSYD